MSSCQTLFRLALDKIFHESIGFPSNLALSSFGEHFIARDRKASGQEFLAALVNHAKLKIGWPGEDFPDGLVVQFGKAGHLDRYFVLSTRL